MGRQDIYSLHGNAGDRAATWHDKRNGVCWFLGWIGQHDYAELEARATNGKLLPDVKDLTALAHERQTLDFGKIVGPRLRKMVDLARDDPGEPVRHTVGNVIRLDITVHVVRIDDTNVGDVYITARMPLLDKLEGVPGKHILQRLAELATQQSFDEVDVAYPTEVPDAAGTLRSIDMEDELAIVVQNCTFDSDDH